MLTVVVCPECGRALNPRADEASRPECWDDLMYRCEDCGWGWSNARSPSARRRITRSRGETFEEVREGLAEMLAGAVKCAKSRSKGLEVLLREFKTPLPGRS